MKKLFFSIACCAIANLTIAQSVSTEEVKRNAAASAAALTTTKVLEDGWTLSGTFNFNLSEGGLNTGWREAKGGGEEQVIGVRAAIDYDFDYKKGKVNWLNNFRTRYGITKFTSSGQGFQKTDDFISYTTIYASEIKKNISASVLFAAQTQYDYYFFSPGEIKVGPGFLYKPNTKFSIMFSPAMVNITTKLATEQKDEEFFGVEAGKTIKVGVGSFAQIKANYELVKGINYKGFATFFSDYLNKPGVVIVDWTNNFSMTVNKYIGANVAINLRYNDWEVAKLQIQHSIGVGFSYVLQY